MKFTKLALLNSVLGETLDPLYWTETNEKFAVETHHRVSVQIGDKMDLICPRYDDQMDHNGHMYHRIYQVTEEAFRNCDATKGKRLIDCNKPEQEKKYTVLFQDTNPSPYGLEFTPGVTYYYISTSSGADLDGLDQKLDGGCRLNNMRLAIEVQEEEPYYIDDASTADKMTTDSEVTSQIIADIASETTPGSLLMGVGLGAFGVLLLVLIILAALKLYRKRHPSSDKMLYMSPVDVSRVPLPVHPVVDVKGPMVPQVQGTYHVAHHGAAHQASPPPPYGMSYTTLVPCNIHPSQMNLTHTTDSQSDHSTNHSYLTRDSFPIHNGDVCEV